jgi:hypothetical protein
MSISVTIDSNAWNYFFKAGTNLSIELPPEEFSLFITREVEIEIENIPEIGKDGSDKRPLKEYIRSSIQSRQIKTTAIFGFAEANPTSEPARYTGFGQGTFQSEQERDWRSRQETKQFLLNKSKRPTGLAKNEADVSIAIASLNSVVITDDRKNGPIPEAAQCGGCVVYLSDFSKSSLSLSEFVSGK